MVHKGAGDAVVRTELFDELSDTIFTVAIAAAIGLGAANIGVEVTKQQAASHAPAGEKLGKFSEPSRSPSPGRTDVDAARLAF
jgi:hypothetical protein